MIRGENTDSIPIDLVNEILSRLPAKSIARFHCVSKLWSSMILRPYFTDLFLTRSSARPPCLLFAVQLDVDGDEWCFFTSSQPQNPYDEESSSLVVTADRHMQFLGDNTWLETCGYASGLICFCRHRPDDKRTLIFNPSTGQYTSLPIPKKWIYLRSYLGFDPIEKQFKVLSIRDPNPNYDEKGFQYEILTLGTRNVLWRKIHCPLNHFPNRSSEGICINGILYYLGEYIFSDKAYERRYVLVCFDVRSEKFKFINRDFIYGGYHPELVNYKGKLGVFTLTYDYYPGTRRSVKLYLSILKNDEKPESEWSEYIYTFWENQFPKCNGYEFWENPIIGVTATVEIEYTSVQVFVDYVEDLKFLTMKTTYNAATSIAPPEQKRDEPKSTSSKAHQQQQDGRMFESINKFDSLRLLDDDDFT
ncbi:hypothetical protein EUTSA_v10012205mg [Eutrema salsugineum]|uniref:F-box domain-containing protein n=1 Tax=Eutrema salsugineum TaxID=72664 RepID=V4MGV3_EUTSA|nr:putative F-box protein At1g60370 [Eutrema salsugineum]ESQ30526.1 hypothetical protein EUTSA_v10012205mg [Eutrema salsugineum]